MEQQNNQSEKCEEDASASSKSPRSEFQPHH